MDISKDFDGRLDSKDNGLSLDNGFCLVTQFDDKLWLEIKSSIRIRVEVVSWTE